MDGHGPHNLVMLMAMLVRLPTYLPTYVLLCIFVVLL
jgi:hypothetical protein